MYPDAITETDTPAFGENLLVAPDASLQDGFLDISVYPDFEADRLSYFGKVMDGGHSGDGKVQHYQARKLKVKAFPKLDVMGDGIALGKGTVTIKMRPSPRLWEKIVAKKVQRWSDRP